MLFDFVMGRCPDVVWDLCRWVINYNRARTRYPNPFRYMRFQRLIRAELRK